MPSSHTGDQQRRDSDAPPPAETEHSLIAVVTYLPGREPSNYDIDHTKGLPGRYRTRFWRCRHCGQERNRRSEFPDACTGKSRTNPVSDGGYSIDDPRTRRALSEDMTVHFADRGSTYVVESESGTTYEVDIETETCTCPDHRKRDVTCKHIRRVDLEIRTGATPQPDGTFRR